MNIKELKELIDATIYPNGEKKIKASSHQLMLHEIVDSSFEKAGVIDAKVDDVDERLKESLVDINNKTGSLTNELEATNTKLDSGLEKTKLDGLVLNQKIVNLASNIVGLGNNIKGEAKGGGVINLPSIALNSVAPSYKIEGLTATQLAKNGDIHFNLTDTAGGNMVRFNASTGDLIYYKIEAFVVEDINMNFCGTNLYNINKSKKEDITTSDIIIIADNSDPRIGLWGSRGSTVIKQREYFNLTQTFGAGNEPTKEWCDAHFKDYFDGTKSVELPVRIKGNTNFYINSKATLKSALQAKDYVKNGTLFKNIFTTKEFKKDDVRRQYINESLVKTYAFYFDIEENVWLKDGFVNNNRVARFSDGETYSCIGSTIATDVEDIIFFIENGGNCIMLKINRSKIDRLSGATPLDKFKAYMGNRSLIINYQANTEQVKLDTSGIVTTKSNGTIFIENIKNVTDFYTANGLDVKDFKELVSIYKYEGSDSVQLDASKAVFATTLKHPDLQDGDLVFFEYKYLDSSLWGDNEIEYFNKNNVLQSENGKLWQKVEKASNEGVLTTELKEIV